MKELKGITDKTVIHCPTKGALVYQLQTAFIINS